MKLQSIAFVFMPGAVEALERRAIRTGNMAWLQWAAETKQARNICYSGALVTILPLIASRVFKNNNPVIRSLWHAVSIFGAMITALSGSDIHKCMMVFDDIVSRDRQSALPPGCISSPSHIHLRSVLPIKKLDDRKTD
jgi:hypothetical protein